MWVLVTAAIDVVGLALLRRTIGPLFASADMDIFETMARIGWAEGDNWSFVDD